MPTAASSSISKRAFGSLISRITDIMVTLLPDPDSPTMPSVSPSDRVSDTPSTALTRPSSVRKETLRSRTSSSGSPVMAPPSCGPSCGPDPRIEPGVADVDEGVGQHDEERPVHHGGHDRRQVEVGQGLIGEIADPVDAEDHLGEQRPAGDQGPEVKPEQAHERDHGGAQRVPQQHLPLGDPLRAGGPDE